MPLFRTTRMKTAAAGGGLVTAAMVSAAVFLGLTSNIGAPMSADFEGMVLRNYVDTVGVETWCFGETQMGRLDKGYTPEYCKTLFYARYPQYAAQLYACYDEKAKRYVTPAMHAAFTDLFYNTGAKCKTGMVRKLQAGKPVEACEYTLKYKRAGGRDCSKDQGNPKGCYGVWQRRLKMLPICLEDARKIPPKGLGPESVL